VEKHVSSIFLKLGVHEDSQISRRVTAVLTYLEDESPTP
jgi:DNA-binding NarL/FixJ family response regulator